MKKYSRQAPPSFCQMKKYARWVSPFFLMMCTKKNTQVSSNFPHIVYDCDLSRLGESSNGFANMDVYFSEVERRDEKTLYLLVSDDRFAASDASALLIVDTEKNRVDQVRTRDGKPQEVSLKLSVVTKDQALGYTLSKLGMLIIENASQVLRANANADSSAKSISFLFDGASFSSSTAKIDTRGMQFSYQPLPQKIESPSGVLCQIK